MGAGASATAIQQIDAATLAAWLVDTGQIDGDPVAPSVYWTNGLAL